MKVDRLVSIIMILLEKERVGARELADMFEVSPRTVYRDIDAINMAGIPVRSVPGVGGGFEIMENYKVDKKVFSTADLSAILTGLSGLSSMIRGDELANALAKVKSFIPPGRAKDIELKAGQICIELSPWMCSRNLQPYLETVKTALEESRLLSFGYIAPRKRNGTYGRAVSACAEERAMVFAGVLPQEKRFPPVQALPHVKPSNIGGDLFAAGVSEAGFALCGNAGDYADKHQAPHS